MKNVLWDSKEAAEATGGENTCDWVATGVSIDTRALKKGDIFVALTDKRDGHEFVAEGFRQGAAAAIVSYIPSDVSPCKPLLIVKDVKLALGALAEFGRSRFKGQVIGITGSVGKTSSKEMLAIVLSSFGTVSASEKNFNNHLGVPLTLARTPPDSEFMVVEIGMSNKKEIAPLSEIVRPNVALITNVSDSHLASFKNVNQIAKEKSDICVGLQKDDACIISRDSDQYFNLSKYIQKFGVKIISYGENKFSKCRLLKTVINNNQTCAQATLKSGREFFFKVNSPGVHHAQNALGVICVLEVLGLDITRGIFELSNWFPTSGRGSITNIQCNDHNSSLNFTVIDESYNANPVSMHAALKELANYSISNNDKHSSYSGRKVAIVGDMLELGSTANKKHTELAARVDFEDIDVVHCIGTCMSYFYKKLPISKKGKWVQTAKELVEVITELVKDQDIIMIKASNGVGLNILIKELKAMGKCS